MEVGDRMLGENCQSEGLRCPQRVGPTLRVPGASAAPGPRGVTPAGGPWRLHPSPLHGLPEPLTSDEEADGNRISGRVKARRKVGVGRGSQVSGSGGTHGAS